MTLVARTLTPGTGTGIVLVLGAPLSFWGGFDAHDGRIIDRNHPQHDVVLTGRVVAMAAGRGSSSASSVLAEAIRLQTAPAAIVLGRPDAIVALGALAASELYGTAMPIVACAQWAGLPVGQRVTVTATVPGGDATIDVRPA